MVKAYGAKGIYLDQLGSAEPMPCYDVSHSHADIGDFNHGYVTILTELRKRLKELDTDTYLMIENCGDIYSPHIWGNLIWNGDPYDEFFNLYKYTFPEFTLVHMVNPITELDGEARKVRFYKDMERATLLGAIFWLGLEKFAPEDEGLLGYARKTVPFRGLLTPLIKNGTYVDTEDILCVSPGLRVSHWLLKDGRHLYVVGNREEKSGEYFEIRAPERATFRVESENIDGVPEQILVHSQGDRATIFIPAYTLSYVLLTLEK